MKIRQAMQGAAAIAGLALVVGALGAVAGGCSSKSSPPPPCNESPFECAAGQTCWATDVNGDFECQNSGPGGLGASCTPYANEAPGCGDGLICVPSQSDPMNGTCLAYCSLTDPSHTCASGSVCAELLYGDDMVPLYVCNPQASTQPAMTDAGVGD